MIRGAMTEQDIREQMLIDGEWVDAADGRVIEIESPRDHAIIGQVPRGGEADVDTAVRAARAAQPGWRD